MKCKVRLTHTVELFVEAESTEQVQNWLNVTTPEQAIVAVDKYIESNYTEEILCYVREDSEVDMRLN